MATKAKKTGATKGPTRPEPVTVPSDSYEIEKDGVVYHPHMGETVTLYRGMGVGEVNAFQAVFNAAEVIKQSKGDEDAFEQSVAALHDSASAQIKSLAKRVTAWTWTDYTGEPLPEPHNNPDAFSSLLYDELVWLVAASQGETDDERKNGSSG